MKKNDVFTFTAPNGVEMTAVVLHRDNIEVRNIYLCYAQNRLFIGCTDNQWIDTDCGKQRVETPLRVKEVVADYAILPDYDAMLEAEQQKFDEDCYEALSSIGDIEF